MLWYRNMTSQQKKDFKKVIIIGIIGAIIVLLIPMVFYSAPKGDTIESREALLNDAISGGSDWTIAKETEIDGYIISCAYSTDGKSTIAVFEPGSNGKYIFSTSTNRDSKNIIVGGAIINGEWYDLVWFNGVQTEYAEVIYTINGVKKEALKYDTANMDLVCIKNLEKIIPWKFIIMTVKETDMNKVLNGKIALVTGANSGMGMATTKALADMGATVVMLCRNEKRGMEAFNALKEISDRKLDLMFCDLGDFSSIRAFAEVFHQKYEKLDILVNNAGFISLDRQITKDGLERQFGVNHIGHFLLTMKLVDLFEEGGRIVNVASGAHKTGNIHFKDVNLTKGFNVIKAYSQSKLANVLFTRELARRLKSKKITVNCCHPGAVATNIGISRETGFGKTITGLLKPFFQTPEQGARTAIYLAASTKVKDITGQYFYKCKIAKSSSRSKDMVLAKRLFELSEQIVGEKF